MPQPAPHILRNYFCNKARSRLAYCWNLHFKFAFIASVAPCVEFDEVLLQRYQRSLHPQRYIKDSVG